VGARLPRLSLVALATALGCAAPPRLTAEVGLHPTVHPTILPVVPYPAAFRHIVIPLDVNLAATAHETNGESLRGGLKSVRYNVEVRWDTIAVSDIAREHGIETVHYADLEILSFFGVWEQRILHVYGR
jgi:hypothetical protein